MRSWLVALCLVACHGSFGTDDHAPVTASPSPRREACTALARATCARLEACAPAFARISVGATCVESLTDHCFRTAGLAGSTRDLPALTACASATPSLSCRDLFVRYPDVCGSTSGPGLLANDVACAFDEQCRSGRCVRPVDSACGLCAAAIVDATIGQPCSPTTPCSRLLFCDVNRCAPRKKLGETCGGLGQCDPFETAVCNETFQCEAARTARLGEPCSFTANALTLCEAPARCIDDLCAVAKREGETCGTNGAHECDGFDADCVRSVCVRRTVELCGQR